MDRVACTAVLEHVVNEVEVLKEIRRVLKRGGVAVIDVPGIYHLKNKLSDLFIKRQKIFPLHREYTVNRMKKLIEKVGLKLLSFNSARFIGSLLFPIIETIGMPNGRKIIWCRGTLAKVICKIGDRISLLCGKNRFFRPLGGSWFFKIRKD